MRLKLRAVENLPSIKSPAQMDTTSKQLKLDADVTSFSEEIAIREWN